MTCLEQLQYIMLCLMHCLTEQRQTSNWKEKYVKWTLVAWGRNSELANDQCLLCMQRNMVCFHNKNVEFGLETLNLQTQVQVLFL